MNMLLVFLTAIQFAAPPFFYNNPDLSERQAVEQAILTWADATFLTYEKYTFENYTVFYEDEYATHKMRIEMYDEKIIQLKEERETETAVASIKAYDTEIKKLEDNRLKIKSEIPEGSTLKTGFYSVSFWSNIKTLDGVSVYYEIKLKLDASLTILEAFENSSIGKKNAATEILYKKTAVQKVTPKL